MQQQEFDKAMIGKWEDAKWMDLSEQKEPVKQQVVHLTHRLKQMPIPEKNDLRKLIKEYEIGIPMEMSIEIQAFVDQQRRWSVPEQNIRRKVKKKFGIVVV